MKRPRIADDYDSFFSSNMSSTLSSTPSVRKPLKRPFLKALEDLPMNYSDFFALSASNGSLNTPYSSSTSSRISSLPSSMRSSPLVLPVTAAQISSAPAVTETYSVPPVLEDSGSMMDVPAYDDTSYSGTEDLCYENDPPKPSLIAPEDPIPSLPAVSAIRKKKIVLAMLREARISPIDLLAYALDPDQSATWYYRKQAYGSHSPKINDLFSVIDADSSGRMRLHDWTRSSATDIIAVTVSNEMNQMTKSLRSVFSVRDMTPDFLRSWSLSSIIVKPSEAYAPTLLRILRAAISTQEGQAKNRLKENDTVRYSAVAFE